MMQTLRDLIRPKDSTHFKIMRYFTHLITRKEHNTKHSDKLKHLLTYFIANIY